MSKSLRAVLCILLCAAMILPGVFSVGAEEHSHEHEDEADASAAPAAAASEKTPTASVSTITGTEKEIEEMACEFSPTKKHELGNTNGIFPYPGGKMIRGELNIKYFEASCTHASGFSSERPCKYCYTWFTVTAEDNTSNKSAAKGHTFGAPTSEKSNCDNVTYTTKVCTTCGYVEVTSDSGKINLENHTTVTEAVRPRNCTTDNVTITRCTSCNIVLECTDDGPNGHRGIFSIVKNGTCTQNGEQEFKCYDCNTFTLKRDIVTVGNHFYGSNVKGQTCTEPGTKTWACIYCGAKDEKGHPDEKLEPLGHDWVDVEASACTSGKTQRCKRCNETRLVDGDGTINHTWGDVQEKAPTCTEAGYKYKTCLKCGAVEITEPNTKDPLPHSYTITVTLVQATCGAEGVEAKKCSKCGHVSEETTVVPATGKHTPEMDDGDCTTSVVCSVCGQTTTPAKEAHDWKYTEIPSLQGATKFHKKTCTTCRTTVEEQCSGSDDGNCMTPIICEHCGSTIKEGSIHLAGPNPTYVPVVGEEDDYHVALCFHNGCNQPVTNTKEAHTYVDGVCTKCQHHHGRDHTPNGKLEYDDDSHWERCAVCGARVNITSHDKSVTDAYEGDCTKALVCSCGKVVREASQHTFSKEWQTNDQYHYRICTNPGCEHKEEFDHKVVDDHDCTTPNKCTECGYVAVSGADEHSWVAAESGHTEAGHKLECSNDGCDAEKTEAHTAGIGATCCTQAECKICHTPFGEFDYTNHSGKEEIRGAKEATETEEGYTGDVYCLGCDKIKKQGTAIEKKEPHKHEYTEYIFDGTTHTPKCSICGHLNVDEKSEHVFGSYEKVDETEHSRKCTICGCVDREPHEHSEDKHDCTESIVCVDCNAVIVEGKAEHSFNGRVVGTAEGHSRACTNENCSVVSTPAPHTGGSSSCQSGAHCEVCDYEYLPSDPAVHTGGTEVRDHKDPTTTEKGYTGDTYCLGCGALIETGTDIDKLPEEHTHTFGEWVTDATHHWKKCECGAVDSYDEHTFYKGVCAVCGTVDPSYTEPPKALVDHTNSFIGTFPEEDADFYRDIELVVEKLDETNKDYAGVKDSVGSRYKEFVPFDVTLFNVTNGKKVQPNGKLTISIPVPEGWTADKTLVFHVSGDKTESVKVTVTKEDGKSYVSFTVDHLSVYVLANAETEISAVPPQTGDINMIAALGSVLILAAAGTAATFCTKRRHH